MPGGCDPAIPEGGRCAMSRAMATESAEHQLLRWESLDHEVSAAATVDDFVAAVVGYQPQVCVLDLDFPRPR
jgi:hypothetical protein